MRDVERYITKNKANACLASGEFTPPIHPMAHFDFSLFSSLVSRDGKYLCCEKRGLCIFTNSKKKKVFREKINEVSFQLSIV